MSIPRWKTDNVSMGLMAHIFVPISKFRNLDISSHHVSSKSAPLELKVASRKMSIINGAVGHGRVLAKLNFSPNTRFAVKSLQLYGEEQTRAGLWRYRVHLKSYDDLNRVLQVIRQSPAQLTEVNSLPRLPRVEDSRHNESFSSVFTDGSDSSHSSQSSCSTESECDDDFDKMFDELKPQSQPTYSTPPPMVVRSVIIDDEDEDEDNDTQSPERIPVTVDLPPTPPPVDYSGTNEVMNSTTHPYSLQDRAHQRAAQTSMFARKEKAESMSTLSPYGNGTRSTQPPTQMGWDSPFSQDTVDRSTDRDTITMSMFSQTQEAVTVTDSMFSQDTRDCPTGGDTITESMFSQTQEFEPNQNSLDLEPSPHHQLFNDSIFSQSQFLDDSVDCGRTPVVSPLAALFAKDSNDLELSTSLLTDVFSMMKTNNVVCMSETESRRKWKEYEYVCESSGRILLHLDRLPQADMMSDEHLFRRVMNQLRGNGEFMKLVETMVPVARETLLEENYSVVDHHTLIDKITRKVASPVRTSTPISDRYRKVQMPFKKPSLPSPTVNSGTGTKRSEVDVRDGLGHNVTGTGPVERPKLKPSFKPVSSAKRSLFVRDQ